MKKQKLYYSSLAYALTAVIIGLPTSAQAAPGTLSQQPLFTTVFNTAESNVFFLTDDSRSMDWDMLTLDRERDSRFTANQPNGTDIDAAGPVKHRDDDNDGTTDCGFNSGDRDGYMYIVDFDSNNLHSEANNCNVADDEAWRARNSSFNPLYFDPTKDYKPWGGVNIEGHTYKHLSVFNLTNAPDDPYNPAKYINLSTHSSGRDADGNFRTSDRDSDGLEDGFRFYTWTDDGDGIFENGEETEYQIGKVTDAQAAALRDPVDADYTATMLKQNFANWFIYHRKREYVAKYAFSTAIENMTGVRMGYGTINNNKYDSNDSISRNIEIASMNLQPATGNKRALLDKLFITTSNNSTPVVENFDKVGKYFDYVDNSFFGNTADYTNPILPADQGGACQINNTIIMTDGYYRDGSETFNLASVAAQYYDDDLHPGTALEGIQRMNTYTIAFGVNGTLDPFDTITPGDASDTDPNATDFVGWPNPTDSNLTKIDDLWHAAVNGHGLFLSAASSNELAESLMSAVGHIVGRTQSATSVTMPAFRSSDDSLIFFSSFNPLDWSGELMARRIAADGGLSDGWDAATLLDANPSNRTILSFNGEEGIAFQWGSTDNCSNCLSPAMKAEISAGRPDINKTDGTSTPYGLELVKYLRGVGSDEITFRERSSLLGDIVNSSPVHVGAPASSYPDTAPFGDSSHRYFSFWRAKKDRTPIIYVGANDGMLHGFNANTGAEELAYVPKTFMANLHELSEPTYGDTIPHRFFVDETPTVADAFFAQHRTGDKSWKTVLTSGLGAGGKGLFALDISNPANFSESTANAESTVLWEFNAADEVIDLNNVSTLDDYSYLGHTFGQPVIGLMENGRWAAIVGNGYNSDAGIAALFIIYLDANPSDINGWEEGEDYIKISTTVGGNASDADKNGLSSPTAIDSNGDGYVDRVYAGDLKGNMWAFSLTGSVDDWDVDYTNSSNTSVKQPLFQAKDAAGVAQPITVKPSVIRNPAHPSLSNVSPNLLVLFGTGQYLTDDDLSYTQPQSFYGIWDNGEAIEIASDAPRTDKLVEQIITQNTSTGQNTIEARITSETAVPYGASDTSQRFGWYIDLEKFDADSGERVISDAVVFNDIVFFTTFIPDTNACGSGGDGWFMFLNAANGGHPAEPIININNDSLVNEDDTVTLGSFTNKAPSGLKTNTLASPTLDLNGYVLIHNDDREEGVSTIDKIEAKLGGEKSNKRISWRELRPD